MFFELIELCLVIEEVADVLEFVDLGEDELVSDLFECWQVGDVFLEHDENHPSQRRRYLNCSLFSVVEAQPFERLFTQEMEAAEPGIITIEWVVAPVRIGPVSLVRGCSPYTCDL